MWSPLVVVFLEVSFDAFCSFQARELNAVHLLSNFVPSFEVMLKELSHSSRPPTTTGANNKNWGLSHGTPCPQHAYRRSNFLTTCHLLVGILYWVLSINFCSCNQVEEHREKGGVRIETANHKLITCPIPVDLVEHVSYYDEQGSDGSCMKLHSLSRIGWIMQCHDRHSIEKRESDAALQLCLPKLLVTISNIPVLKK